MQQAVLQAYFKVYFHDGKDIGNLDTLGDIAQSVGLMSKAEVCVQKTNGDMLIAIVDSLFISDDQLLEI